MKFKIGILAFSSAEKRFTRIYALNHWRGDESASGRSSTIDYTVNLRAKLRDLVVEHSIEKILDAPCGDFNWMKEFLHEVDVDYIGCDIVGPLIEGLKLRYSSERVSFVHLDLTRDRLPKADLMICRDCLFHLSYADTTSVLHNFLSAGIPYLLTTTHRNDGTFSNRDIETGDFRMMDLFSAPYHFPTDYLAIIDDWVPPDPERQICLWTRSQVEEALARFQ